MSQENSNWLKIGDFATFCGTSTKTLRFYDIQGLLHPAYRDNETGYRYYDITQYLTYSLIKTLRSMGTSIEDVKTLLESEKPVDDAVLLLEERVSKVTGEIEQLETQRREALDTIRVLKEHAPREEGVIKLEYLPRRMALRYQGNVDFEDIRSLVDAIADIRETLARYFHDQALFIHLGGMIAQEYLGTAGPFHDKLVAFLDTSLPPDTEGVFEIHEGLYLCILCRDIDRDSEYAARLLEYAQNHGYAVDGSLEYEWINQLLTGHYSKAGKVTAEYIRLPVRVG